MVDWVFDVCHRWHPQPFWPQLRAHKKPRKLFYIVAQSPPIQQSSILCLTGHHYLVNSASPILSVHQHPSNANGTDFKSKPSQQDCSIYYPMNKIKHVYWLFLPHTVVTGYTRFQSPTMLYA